MGAQHLILGMQEFDLPDELVPGALGQEEQEGMKEATHGDRIQVMEVKRGRVQCFCTPPFPGSK